MRVYAFAEYYPNPFKPYLDTQFAQTVADGHELRIFAFGSWGDPGNATIAEYGLTDRTRYIPGAPRHLPRLLAPAIANGLTRPARVADAWRVAALPARRRLVLATQAALLPREEPDLCLIHDLGTAVRLAALRAIYPRARIAMYYHGGEVAPGVVRGATDAREGYALAETVFTNTAYSRDDAVERGCPAERIHVLPVGFDLRRFAFAPSRNGAALGATGAGPHTLRLVTVGRLSADKGLHHAIEAVRLLRAQAVPVECTLIGDGDERGALERRVAAAGLQGIVRFPGTMTHEAVTEALASADALLLPSVPRGTWAETQACVVQEAMLVGAMVIASATGGVPESMPASMHEFLVPPADPAALADAVRRLGAMGPEERAARARANRAFCEARYDIRVLNPRMLALAVGGPRPDASRVG